MAFQRFHALLTLSAVSAALLSTGCGSAGYGDFGITPGGAQDMRLAREIIEDGGIPTADQFTAEGLFSEHDLPLPGDACDQDLCPRAAAALMHPVDGRGARALVQLGFATRHGESFRRAPLNVAVAVDVSGSMSGEKMSSVRTALHAMVEQLGDEDRMSLIKFSSTASRVAAPTIMNAGGRGSMHDKIDRLSAGGGTDIEAGFLKATTNVERNAGEPGVEDRVMVFTDAQPNIGATSTHSFMEIARDNADAGIGLSVFGVGLDLGSELATRISEVRGGNSFYLSDGEAIASVFDEDFDTIVSPVAYDLRFSLVPNELFRFDVAYGVPDADPSGAVDFSVATAFLSNRGGAMAVVLDGPILEGQSEQRLGTISIQYETVDGVEVQDAVDITWRGGDAINSETVQADHAGVAKLAGLVDEFLALRAAASTCEGASASAAEAVVGEAEQRLRMLSIATNDAPLENEARLMEQLAQNLVDGGSCHDGYGVW
jgi:Ca-activated chloride channel family protein